MNILRQNFNIKQILPEISNIPKMLIDNDQQILKDEQHSLEKSGADFEFFNPRTDIFSQPYKIKNFKEELNKNSLFQDDTDLQKINIFFDSLFNRFMIAINGAPIINSIYSYTDIHNYELIKNNKSIYCITGGFQKIIESLILHGIQSGITQHQDLTLSYLPFNNFFNLEKILEEIKEIEKSFKSNILKNKKKRLLKMKFNDEQSFQGRIVFLRLMLELQIYLEKPFEKTKTPQLNEILGLLSKVLIIIERTYNQPKDENVNQDILQTLLAQNNVINLKFIQKEILFSKYENMLNSIKIFMKIFHEELSLHEIFYTQFDFYRYGGNLFSRIYLFKQFFRIAHVDRDFCLNFFKKFTKKEISLYLFPSQLKNKQKEMDEIAEQVVEKYDGIIHEIIKILNYQPQKQFSKLQKILSKVALLFQIFVSQKA